MHEMAIAGALLDSVLEGAEGRDVLRVHLRIGHLRQVVPSALRFSWTLITRGTVAEGSTLEIDEVPAVGACRKCGEESPQPRFPFRCGACGGLEIDVVRGEELMLEWLEVEQPTGEPTETGDGQERLKAV
jgi:hydrogenase nickel incorporation protein HypA/HybF